MIGLFMVSIASSFIYLLLSVSLIGIGSSIFHPESSRVAHLASGGKRGLAQSIFQVGGNFGTALGPLLVTAKVKVTLLPTFGVSLLTVLTIARSACGTGTGVLVELLFPDTGSTVVLLTVAILA